MTDDPKQENARFLSTARFGPGSIMIFFLLGILATVLYLLGMKYLALIVCIVFTLIFTVKSVEVLNLSRPVQRHIVGRKCLVQSRVALGVKGVVRILDDNGRPEPELWSAESNEDIFPGSTAQIVAMRSIVLIVKPVES
jgi:membrane protein implicated in regulation of membrane protease activity